MRLVVVSYGFVQSLHSIFHGLHGNSRLHSMVPMVRIDSFEDLVKHKDTKIVVREDDSLTVFVKRNDTELKRTLSSMLDPYENNVDPWLKKLANGFKDLSYAYITKRELLIFTLIDIQLYFNKEPPNILDILHLSERTSFFEPIFLLGNNDSPDWLKVNLNRM